MCVYLRMKRSGASFPLPNARLSTLSEQSVRVGLFLLQG